MAQALEIGELDLIDTFAECEELKSLIMETILDSTDQLSSCVVSFAYVAIQRFIGHCKDHGIDPLTMPATAVQDFIDNCLKKELYNEMRKPLPATTTPEG